jgi:hypothetical protein
MQAGRCALWDSLGWWDEWCPGVRIRIANLDGGVVKGKTGVKLWW